MFKNIFCFLFVITFFFSCSELERKTEKELKARKLGVWARGLKAGVVKYDKEIHDDERNEKQRPADTYEAVARNECPVLIKMVIPGESRTILFLLQLQQHIILLNLNS